MLRWSIWLGPVVALLVAMLDMPYGYYQLLRVIIFCVSVYLAIAEGKQDYGFWTWAFIACGLIYNPITKLSLGSQIWPFVNIATALLLLAHFWARRNLINSGEIGGIERK